jgi:hypothetical protein
VHDRTGARKRWAEGGGVGDIALDQFEALRQAAGAGGEIVEEDDVVSCVAQGASGVTADVACSTNDEDRQESPRLLRSWSRSGRLGGGDGRHSLFVTDHLCQRRGAGFWRSYCLVNML